MIGPIVTPDGSFTFLQVAMAMLVFFPLFLLLLGAIFGFCVWMFVDCLRRTFPDKAVWLVAFILSVPLYFTFWIALLYYLTVRRKNVGTISAAASNPPDAPAAKL